MIKSYFKIAWRNLKKNKVFSFINIFGLSVGLACCILITLYINHELSYDKYHRNANDIYQVGTVFIKEGKEDKKPNTPALMAEMMKAEFPEITETSRLIGLFAEDKTLLQYSENASEPRSFYESRGYLADPSFFTLFSYDFIEGQAANSLLNPNSVVLSEEIAKKIFGDKPALNKLLRISSSTNGDHDFTVTGVYKTNIKPSHIDAGFFISIKGGGMEVYIKENCRELASNNMFFTYLMLKPGADAKRLEAKFPAFMEKHAGKDLRAMGFNKKQFLVQLKDIHLRSGMDQSVTASGSLTYLYILGSIALFILLIGCINFMNLSTARSSKRSAEVGIRKVLGAEKNALVRQFLGESVLISCIAFVFAILLAKLFLAAFNSVSGKDISLSFGQNWLLIAGFLLLAVFTGLLAGSYPAFYLSSFKPIKVLKGRFTNSLAAVSLRKGLVIFQFMISVVLIIASVVISGQMNFMRSTDLGFTKDRQVVIPLRSENAKAIYPSFKNELKRMEQVQGVGASFYYPGIFNPSDNGFYRDGQTMNEARRTRMNTVDASFLQTLGIKPIAGRLFSEQFPADTNFRVILNETAIKDIGFTSAQEAVGKKVYFDWRGEKYGFDVIGVVKDFHFEDLHLAITPFGFQLHPRTIDFNYILVNAKQGDMGKLLLGLEKNWHALNPNEPFEYSFLDDDFQKNYLAESRLASIVGYFTIIAIFISCLGLFGLATFSAEQRTKEIGIRKVMGASVANVVGLLSKDFLKLVFVAIIIASPLAWYAMNKWLQDFAYRISLAWWIFLLAGFIAVLIAFVTISFQAIKAASANPVKSLRTE